MSVHDGRHLRRMAGLALVLLVVTSASGCLSPLDREAATPASGASVDEPEVPDADADAPTPEPGVLRIQGDQVLDRLADRMRWKGSGAFADPYLITGLELQDTLLVFQDITRAVTLQRSVVEGPAKGPALMVWNATGFSIEDSTIRARAGPAVSFLETSWSRVTGSHLESQHGGIHALSSEAIDLIDNDLHAGTTAIRFEAGTGDHWIEDNRVHRSEVAIEILDETRASTLYDNVLKGETGVRVQNTPGPLLEGNDITAHDGLRLDDADDALLLHTVIHATGTALHITTSERVLVDALNVTGTARGIFVQDSVLTLVANLTYEGPGPGIEVEGGSTPVIATSTILLPAQEEGQAIVMREVEAPVILDAAIGGGSHGIVLDRTTHAAIIEGLFVGFTEAVVLLQDTTGTLVSGSTLAVAPEGIVAEGGAKHQFVENRLDLVFRAAILATGTTDMDVAFNHLNRSETIKIHDSVRPVVDRNTIIDVRTGVHLTASDGASIHGNAIRAARGIIVEDHAGPEGLLITENAVSGGTLSQEAVRLSSVAGVVMRGNTLLAVNGLVLQDVTRGLVYDNYFDNRFDVVASGTMDILWNVSPRAETNVVGGPLVAGNWWHDYTGADLDKDGLGDIPHGVLPYEEEVGNALPAAGSYGVQDEAPIVSNGTTPGTPTSIPDRDPTQERISALFGQHPALDRILRPYA